MKKMSIFLKNMEFLNSDVTKEISIFSSDLTL